MKSRSIKFLCLAIFLPAMIISFLIANLTFFILSRKSIEESQRTGLSIQAKYIKNYLQSEIKSRHADLHNYAVNPIVLGGLKFDTYSKINWLNDLMLKDNENYLKIEVFNSSRVLVSSSVQGEDNMRGQEFFEIFDQQFPQSENEVVHIGPIVDSLNGLTSYLFFKTIYADPLDSNDQNDNQQILGYVVFHYNWGNFYSFLNESKKNDFQSDGGMINHLIYRNKKLLLGNENLEREFQDDFSIIMSEVDQLKNDNVHFAKTSNFFYTINKTQIDNFKKSDEWTVVSFSEIKNIVSSVYHLLFKIILVNTICLGLLSLLIIYISNKLSNPFKVLNSTIANVIQNSNYETKVEVKGVSEIEELVQLFNDLLLNLKQTTVSKEFVDDIIESNTDSFVVTDNSGKIKMMNKSFNRLLKISYFTLLNTHIKDYLGPHLMINPETGFSEGQTEMGGMNRTIEVSNYSLSKADSMVWYIKDITQMRATEEKLIQEHKNAEVAARLAALGEVAGGVAHEINNPLSIISGSSLKLKKMAKNNEVSAPAVIEIAEKIDKTILRITKIIKGLKTLVRDGSSDPFEQVTFDQLINDINDFTEAKIRSAGTSFSVIKDEKLHQLECRSVQIIQVLINLVNNGVDAVTDLSNKWVKLVFELDQEFVVIKVLDSGAGIPAGLKEKVLQPLFTTKAVGKGTGLGLSISLRIVQDHGGTLEIGEENQHTCIKVRLPLVQISTNKTAAGF
jgi:signal transduction histidine kinase